MALESLSALAAHKSIADACGLFTRYDHSSTSQQFFDVVVKKVGAIVKFTDEINALMAM